MSPKEFLTFPQKWMTIEDHPRMLTALGVAAASVDDLVAVGPNGEKGIWIGWNGYTDQRPASVLGLEPMGVSVKAVRIMEPQS